MVYIAYITELILQICDYTKKRRIWRENCKYVLDENFHCHFCSQRKAAKFCHPVLYSDAHVKDIWHFCRVLCNPLPGWVKEKGKEIIINTNAVIQRSFKEGNYKYSTVWDNYYNFVWFPPDVLMRGYSLQIVYSLSKRRPPLTKKGISSKLIAMDLGTLTRFLIRSSTISNLLLNKF